MRFYAPISKVDAEQRMVFGYASTECIDDQGDVVTREALSDALDGYMRFANIREMHQPSAVGVTKDAKVDDHGLYLAAKIVDDDAWRKVIEGVYKGFSIGGRIKARDPNDRKRIVGLDLSEVSVVDRPANPEAVFDCWKSSEGGAPAEPASTGDDPMSEGGLGKLGTTPAGAALAALVPQQIWTCGEPAHRHTRKDDAAECVAKRNAAPPAEIAGTDPASGDMVAKQADPVPAAADADSVLPTSANPEPIVQEPSAAEAVTRAAEEAIARAAEVVKGGDAAGDGSKPYGSVPYADPGFQEDGKKRYPIDTAGHIRAAWSYINKPKNQKGYSGDQVDKIKARIVAAWKDKIDDAGPPSADDTGKAAGAALVKSLYDVGLLAEVILALDNLADRLAMERFYEGDDSDVPDMIEQIVTNACAALRAMVAEETAEIMAGTEMPEMPDTSPIAYADRIADLCKVLAAMNPADGADADAVARVEKLNGYGAALGVMLANSAAAQGPDEPPPLVASATALKAVLLLPDMSDEAFAAAEDAREALIRAGAALSIDLPEEFKEAVGRRMSAGNQELCDMAYHACAKACAMSGATQAQKASLEACKVSLVNAGARTGDPDGDADTDPDADDMAARKAAAVSTMMIETVAKAGGLQALMDVTHDCIGKMTGSRVCGDASKAGSPHSKATMGHLQDAHDHVMKAGANCAGMKAEKGDDEDMAMAAKIGGSNIDLAKRLVEAETTGAELIKIATRQTEMLTTVTAQLAATNETVEKLARTPLPAVTLGSDIPAGLTAVSKVEDGRGRTPQEQATGMSIDDARKIYDGMSEEDRVLLAIRMAHAKPMTMAPMR